MPCKPEQTNSTPTEEKRIHVLFAEQVHCSPDAVALVFADEQLTYAQLDARANALAQDLCELGVGPESIVAICCERSVEMIVGLLGILKAGGAYLPVDPSTRPSDARSCSLMAG
jgi:non-ribosomal peptide synthetase component F